MNTLDFLRACLDATDRPEEIAEPLEALLLTRTREDHRLDYKDGRWAEKLDPQELRRDVSAFANAEGGVLVIGVEEERDERTREVRPVQSPGGCHADFPECRRKVEHILRALVPALTVLPELMRVTLQGGQSVFVLPVPRSDTLVPVHEGSEQMLYLRTGEGRHRMPEYLHADPRHHGF